MSGPRVNALVTGGARRIGRAIVEDLARNGLGVAVHCNTARAEAEALVATIRGQGGSAALVRGDLTDLAVVENLLPAAERALGPVSIVVNNASIFDKDEATDFDWETWDRHFAIHVKAPVALARGLAQRLEPDAEGMVVNIVDQRVLKPQPRYFTYSLSKSALWTATQTLAQALAPKVRVNAIGPGPTFANVRQQPSDFAGQIDGLILKRGPALEEFGATIRYLWKARSITGQLIALDGGQHLGWETPDVAGIVE